MEGGIRNIAVIYSSKFKKTGVNNELFHITDLMPTLYAAAGGNPLDLGKIDGINQWNTLVNDLPTRRDNILVNIDKMSSAFISENGHYKLVNGTAELNESYGEHWGDSGRENNNIPYNIQDILESNVNKCLGNRLTLFKILHIRSQVDLAHVCRRKLDSIVSPCPYNTLCLFDLYTDPCETQNIVNLYPNLVEKLQQKLAYYNKQVIPQKKKFIDPNSNPVYYNNTWTSWLDVDIWKPSPNIYPTY